jgi:hypothetical protein
MEVLEENSNQVIDKFIQENIQGIKTIHRLYLKNDNDLSIRAFTAEVGEELKKGYTTFLSKGYPLDELDPYLFYIVNAVGKQKHVSLDKKHDYLCPGCFFLGKETILEFYKTFECNVCFYEFKNAIDPQWIRFFEVFKVHNKAGFKCLDCGRFIPKPLDNSTQIVCPYTDCFFVGDTSQLKVMHHPSSRGKTVEVFNLDVARDASSLKDNIPVADASALEKIQIKEDFEKNVQILSDVIDGIMYSLPFKTQNLVSKHKVFVCQAFKNLLLSDPVDMVNYLINSSRSGGFQHRIFQEYIRLLEQSFPLFYQEKRKQCKIECLLDERLGLFEGISSFDGIVNDKLTIKNNTKEFYIGGRKSSYAEPYYIGKLLNVISKDSHTPIMHHVISYSFSKIKLSNVKPGTQVIVTHLRVPPHYQMGGMTYVNRVRKHIVEKSRIILKNNV